MPDNSIRMTEQELLHFLANVYGPKIQHQAEFRGETTCAIAANDLREISKFSLVLNLGPIHIGQQVEQLLFSHAYAVVGHAEWQATRLPYNYECPRRQSSERFLKLFCQFRFLVSE